MAVRKGAGAALVLAALSFGSGRSWLGGLGYLLESQLVVQKTRKENLMRQQTQVCFPPDAAAPPPWPPAATAVPN